MARKRNLTNQQIRALALECAAELILSGEGSDLQIQLIEVSDGTGDDAIALDRALERVAEQLRDRAATIRARVEEREP